MKNLAALWKNTYGFRGNLVVRICVGFFRMLLGLALVWESKRLVDDAVQSESLSNITVSIATLLIMVAVIIGLRQLYFYMTAMATVSAANQIRFQMYRSLFVRNLFDEKQLHSGDVASRFSKDVETVSEVLMDTLPQTLVTIFQLFGAFLLFHFLEPRLAWLLLLFTPLTLLVGKFISYRLKRMNLEIRESETRIQEQVQESVENSAVLRSMNSESWLMDLFTEKQTALTKNVRVQTRYMLMTRLFFAVSFGFGYWIAFIWGALGLRDGIISFGMMTAFLQLVGQIQQPVYSLMNMAPKFIRAEASLERFSKLQMENQNHKEDVTLKNPVGIRFQDVEFEYGENSEPVFRHFSFDFKPGTRTAIVGKSGAGKTTLFRLILGFIRPNSGTVTLYSGKEEWETSATQLKNLVFVPQGNTLLSGTIHFNLQLAKPDATDAELTRALHTACADFVLDLPLGLDFKLSERGGGLSEGQAERIAIARGLLRPGNVFLFDEISSALDESTERELYRRLLSEFPQKTMIFVTHRPAIIDLCDAVVRVDETSV